MSRNSKAAVRQLFTFLAGPHSQLRPLPDITVILIVPSVSDAALLRHEERQEIPQSLAVELCDQGYHARKE